MNHKWHDGEKRNRKNFGRGVGKSAHPMTHMACACGDVCLSSPPFGKQRATTSAPTWFWPWEKNNLVESNLSFAIISSYIEVAQLPLLSRCPFRCNCCYCAWLKKLNMHKKCFKGKKYFPSTTMTTEKRLQTGLRQRATDLLSLTGATESPLLGNRLQTDSLVGNDTFQHDSRAQTRRASWHSYWLVALRTLAGHDAMSVTTSSREVDSGVIVVIGYETKSISHRACQRNENGKITRKGACLLTIGGMPKRALLLGNVLHLFLTVTSALYQI